MKHLKHFDMFVKFISFVSIFCVAFNHVRAKVNSYINWFNKIVQLTGHFICEP